jgi:hypothetical protein
VPDDPDDRFRPLYVIELRRLRELYHGSWVADGDGIVLRKLREEVEDHRALFDLQWRRMGEATALWRAEAPEERALIMPDLGALLEWLIDRRHEEYERGYSAGALPRHA